MFTHWGWLYTRSSVGRNHTAELGPLPLYGRSWGVCVLRDLKGRKGGCLRMPYGVNWNVVGSLNRVSGRALEPYFTALGDLYCCRGKDLGRVGLWRRILIIIRIPWRAILVRLFRFVQGPGLTCDFGSTDTG